MSEQKSYEVTRLELHRREVLIRAKSKAEAILLVQAGHGIETTETEFHSRVYQDRNYGMELSDPCSEEEEKEIEESGLSLDTLEEVEALVVDGVVIGIWDVRELYK